MDRDGCSTSKFCVPRKMGTGKGGNKGEKKFLVLKSSSFYSGREALSSGFSLHLTANRQVQGDRDQAGNFYSFYDRARQEMGEMKAETANELF